MIVLDPQNIASLKEGALLLDYGKLLANRTKLSQEQIEQVMGLLEEAIDSSKIKFTDTLNRLNIRPASVKGLDV